MNNLDGITSALVALQLLSLCLHQPLPCVYRINQLVHHAIVLYEGSVVISAWIIHFMKIVFSQTLFY